MATATEYAVVRCLDYNGRPNVLFLMKTSDFRYADLGTWGYQLANAPNECVYDRKGKSVVAGGATYRVFGDWSLKAI